MSAARTGASLKRFVAEFAAVHERTEPLLRLIVCDADLHQIHCFSGCECAKLPRGFEVRGGGGADFRPAIAEAAKWKPDPHIYLTDLEGDAGDEPAFPVLWAVPEGKAEAPWGKFVEMIICNINASNHTATRLQILSCNPARGVAREKSGHVSHLL